MAEKAQGNIMHRQVHRHCCEKVRSLSHLSKKWDTQSPHVVSSFIGLPHVNLKAGKCLLLSESSWQRESLFYTLTDSSLCLLTVPFTLCPEWESQIKSTVTSKHHQVSTAFTRQSFEVNKTIHAMQETQHNVKRRSTTKKSKYRKCDTEKR